MPKVAADSAHYCWSPLTSSQRPSPPLPQITILAGRGQKRSPLEEGEGRRGRGAAGQWRHAELGRAERTDSDSMEREEGGGGGGGGAELMN